MSVSGGLIFQIGRQREPETLQRGDTVIVMGYGECVVKRITPAMELVVLSPAGEEITLGSICWPAEVRARLID